MNFHGISGFYNQNYVDGSNNNQMLFSEARGRASGTRYVYSIDSIKEFQANAATSSAEFGKAAGGQVNAITKSGTNHFHGDAFYYLRYPDLNAFDPYNKYQALHNNGNSFLLTQPIHQQQQFGGSIGGPIMRDRLFFFFTYDGFRKIVRVLYSNSNIISLTPSGPTNSTTTIAPDAVQVASRFCWAQATCWPRGCITTTFPEAEPLLPPPRLAHHQPQRRIRRLQLRDYDSTYAYRPANTFLYSSPSTNGATSYRELPGRRPHHSDRQGLRQSGPLPVRSGP